MPIVLLIGCHNPSAPVAPEPAPTRPGAPASISPADFAFRDAVDEPPPGWSGPRFKLSHDYPATRPDCSNLPWLKRKVSFDAAKPAWDAEWQGYVQDIIDYVWEGQDPDLPDDVGWRTTIKDKDTRWYHMPWMAFDGRQGREFVHGLTNELSISEPTFTGTGRGTGKHHLPGARRDSGADPTFETWAVGFYNPCGGFAIGAGWPASGVPQVETPTKGGPTFAKGLPFPTGTVVVKILNTTADERVVPYLKGSTTWQANAHQQPRADEYATCARQIRKVHLVQMDLAVVDPRSPTRWVYATLAYNGTSAGKTVRDRLQPLGVQWGNDPGSYPAASHARDQPLRQTLLAPIDLPEHYGCNKRLAGVVDQETSSCISCHMGAYTPPPGVIVNPGVNVPQTLHFATMCKKTDQANANYFSDYAYPAPYPGSTDDIAKAIPLDSSLQLQVAFTQYAIFTNPTSSATQSVCPHAGAQVTTASGH